MAAGDEEKTWPHWEDVLGNQYQPGDIVAIAIINGKSPQMVIARVERINRVNSSNKIITARKFFNHPEPIPKSATRKRWVEDSACKYHFPYGDTCIRALGHDGDHSYRYGPKVGHYEEYTHEWLEQGEYREVPSCTIQATPLVDARGFGRYGKDKITGANKKVTYSIPENIILIERSIDLD